VFREFTASSEFTASADLSWCFSIRLVGEKENRATTLITHEIYGHRSTMLALVLLVAGLGAFAAYPSHGQARAATRFRDGSL
jgi:hypothetical protein